MGNTFVKNNNGQVQVQKNADGNVQSNNHPIRQRTTERSVDQYPELDDALAKNGFRWILTNSQECSQLEYKAVVAGYEGIDDSPIYVGRARYDGDLLPCKVIPRHNMAYIAYHSKEFAVKNFEMYCRSGPIVQWLAVLNGDIPKGAVTAGQTKSGEALFVGRAHFNGFLIPGKVYPSQECCYISYDGKEEKIADYEVMIVTDE